MADTPKSEFSPDDIDALLAEIEQKQLTSEQSVNSTDAESEDTEPLFDSETTESDVTDEPDDADAASENEAVDSDSAEEPESDCAPVLAPADSEDAERKRHAAKKRVRRRKHKRKKGRKLSCALILVTFIFALSITTAVGILAVAKEMFGIDKSQVEKAVTIPAGSTTQDIARILEREGLINLPQVFRVISRLNGADSEYIAGDHVLSPSMSYEAMIGVLTDKQAIDAREYVNITFREGITLQDAAKLLEENEVCSASDFIFHFNAGGQGFAFEEHIPDNSAMKFYRMEGYCFPDTYQFYVDEEPEIVVQKIYENFNEEITATDYARMEELNMTLDQVITLASIVQAEAPISTSMKMVSSVFHNRLNNSAEFPLLQSDPTRVYAEDVIQPNLQISNQLMLDSYNTYVGQGLPPGAINNPGRDAIDAVLYPANSEYYFFCANVQTGEIFYAVTNAEHEQNLALIQQQQEQAAAGLTDEEGSSNE